VRLVDVVLQDGSPDHAPCTSEESEADLLDRGEPDASTAQGWVDEEIADWNSDNEGERVKVGDDVIRDAVGGGRAGLGDEVVVQLVVGQPCDRRRVSEIVRNSMLIVWDTHTKEGTTQTPRTP
jgi:hypothetical protein